LENTKRLRSKPKAGPGKPGSSTGPGTNRSKSKKGPGKNKIWEETLALHIRTYKLPKPEREIKFHPVRKWRFDFAWPDQFVAVEVEGGTWSGGRHTTGVGFRNDCEKYNAATALGWRVYRFTSDQVKSGMAIKQISEVIK